ncbi:MAG TPA: hypothetical protein VFO10_18270 [Oligoflexus sp.]|uniref:hypothetical protein n=1 Tax=Oligoflexus sp. TaxID=1971216 RepID=UPI002D803E3D|nr:hypothetical protein [Oligoflexus sp.]HET9239212.1 hypothetical protein [Oligoflexus sp.]
MPALLVTFNGLMDTETIFPAALAKPDSCAEKVKSENVDLIFTEGMDVGVGEGVAVGAGTGVGVTVGAGLLSSNLTTFGCSSGTGFADFESEQLAANEKIKSI